MLVTIPSASSVDARADHPRRTHSSSMGVVGTESGQHEACTQSIGHLHPHPPRLFLADTTGDPTISPRNAPTSRMDCTQELIDMSQSSHTQPLFCFSSDDSLFTLSLSETVGVTIYSMPFSLLSSISSRTVPSLQRNSHPGDALLSRWTTTCALVSRDSLLLAGVPRAMGDAATPVLLVYEG